jgi:hypothetical protein
VLLGLTLVLLLGTEPVAHAENPGHDGHDDPPPPYSEPPPAISSFVAAAKFRPRLLFDTFERWRPLNVERFLAEGIHDRCDERDLLQDTCERLVDWTGLRLGADYIDIGGGENDISSYRSPSIALNDSCKGEPIPNAGLLDCDVGDASAIYYHSVEPADGLRYLDYWFFYRFNDDVNGTFPDNRHEGDWEGMTITAPLHDANFYFASFDAHGNTWRYLRDVLYCGVTLPGSCGTAGEASAAARVNVYVARGGHASYPRPCYFGCQQTDAEGDDLFNEEPSDGMAPWGRNNDASGGALLLFPPAIGWADSSRASWVDWAEVPPPAPEPPDPCPDGCASFPDGGNGLYRFASVGRYLPVQSSSEGFVGKWGRKGCPGLLCPTGPDSPGTTGRFKSPETAWRCTERYTDPGTTNCPAPPPPPSDPPLPPDCSELGTCASTPNPAHGEAQFAAGNAQAGGASGSSGSRVREADPCRPWMGPFVTIAVCNPVVVKLKEDQGQLGREGGPTLSRRGSRDASASAPGLAQLVGAPLTAGDSISIRGSISKNARIIVRTRQESGSVAQSDFDGIELPSGGRVEVETGLDGKRSAVIKTPGGRRFEPRTTRPLRPAQDRGAPYEPPATLAIVDLPFG